VSRQAILVVAEGLEALGAWQHVSHPRRSGSTFLLAAQEQRQVIF